MSSELLWAVTDGPAGTDPVELPEDGPDARRMVAHHGGGFWCSRESGGCGGRLVVDAGDEGRPSFRHRDDGPRCRYTDAGARAGSAYAHLRYQPAVTAWLTAQGHGARVEKVRGRDGTTDLHVVVDDLGCVIEVQLSPLSDTLWRQRDDRYRARAQHVTWLYGPRAGDAAATEAAVRGVSFALRRHGAGLVVGVRDVDDRVRWVRLPACRLSADGFSAPGVEEATALHAERTAERQEAVRRMARQAAGRARTGRGPRGEREGRCPPARAQWAALARPLPFPG